jgi:hypothetical protein
VERVLGHRKVKRGKQIRKEFMVKGLGYEHEHNTWEPEKHLTHCEDLLAAQIIGLMLLLLYRVYERSKQSSGRNGKQRNSSGTAPLKRMQVNLQVVGKCLQDVDEVIERWSNASPQKRNYKKVCL